MGSKTYTNIVFLVENCTWMKTIPFKMCNHF